VQFRNPRDGYDRRDGVWPRRARVRPHPATTALVTAALGGKDRTSVLSADRFGGRGLLRYAGAPDATGILLAFSPWCLPPRSWESRPGRADAASTFCSRGSTTFPPRARSSSACHRPESALGLAGYLARAPRCWSRRSPGAAATRVYGRRSDSRRWGALARGFADAVGIRHHRTLSAARVARRRGAALRTRR